MENNNLSQFTNMPWGWINGFYATSSMNKMDI